jgi:MFS family permease
MSAAKAKDGGSRRWWALILLCVAQFVDVLDINAVIVALPTIGRELGFSHGDLQWVVTSYVLFFGGFLLFAGRLADLFGKRKMFVVGLALLRVRLVATGAGGMPSRSGPWGGDRGAGSPLHHLDDVP